MDSLCLEAKGVRDWKLRVAPLGVEKELFVAIAVVVDSERRHRKSSVEHKRRPIKLTQKTVLEECRLLLKGVQKWYNIIEIVLLWLCIRRSIGAMLEVKGSTPRQEGEDACGPRYSSSTHLYICVSTTLSSAVGESSPQSCPSPTDACE